jgi:hypothetical protein
VGTIFQGVTRPGPKGDHSHLSNLKVKNAWWYTSILLYVFIAWLLIEHRDSFTFTLSSLNPALNYFGLQNQSFKAGHAVAQPVSRRLLKEAVLVRA